MTRALRRPLARLFHRTVPASLVRGFGVSLLAAGIALPWVVVAAGGWGLPSEPPDAPVTVVPPGTAARDGTLTAPPSPPGSEPVAGTQVAVATTLRPALEAPGLDVGDAHRAVILGRVRRGGAPAFASPGGAHDDAGVAQVDLEHEDALRGRGGAKQVAHAGVGRGPGVLGLGDARTEHCREHECEGGGASRAHSRTLSERGRTAPMTVCHDFAGRSKRGTGPWQ